MRRERQRWDVVAAEQPGEDYLKRVLGVVEVAGQPIGGLDHGAAVLAKQLANRLQSVQSRDTVG